MSENLTGKTLQNRYELLEKLGSDGFETIYSAKDDSTSIGGVYVVVKEFFPHYSNPEQRNMAMRLFQQEVDNLKKLGNHPQIPRIIDFFEVEDSFFLVQELVEGKNLQQEFVSTQHFTQVQVIKLLTDILEVLKFIHDSKYIHRNIKPSNLIRNRFNDKFFIINFGAVKEKISPQNITTSGEFSRTASILNPGYTPDEQLNGKPEFYSDIYALGMVAVEALTKINPHELTRNADSKLMWRDSLAPYLEYDPNLLDLIDKMVEKHWEKRSQSATEVLEDLNQISIVQLTVLPQSVAPTPIDETFRVDDSPKPFNLGKMILTGLVLVSAIALPTWLLLYKPQGNKLITYENEDVRVDYPQTWERTYNSNFLSNTVSFTSPKENDRDKFQERVTVAVQNSSRPLSLTEYTKQAVMQIENLSNFILVPPQPTRLARTMGKSVVYQGIYQEEDDEMQVKHYEVWTVNYQKIYTIVYTAQPDEFDKFMPAVEKIIESLEILP